MSDDKAKRRIANWFNWDRSLDSFPRFRSVVVNPHAPQICIGTRTGGGNREEYIGENEQLRQLEGYTADCDASHDATYAEWDFDIPERSHADWEKFVNEFPLKAFR